MDPALAQSLLSIPPRIRKRIYFFADLVRECPVTIVPFGRPTTSLPPQQEVPADFRCAFKFRNERKPDCVHRGKIPECLCPSFPKQLLLVCKQLHKEVEEILYSENKFVIRIHREADDLRVLRTLSTAAIQSLRYLLVRLNSWPCIKGHSQPWRRAKTCSTCLSSLELGDPEITTADESLIKEWEVTCGHLLTSKIIPGQLHLEFICDVDSLEAAQPVLNPLNCLSRLQECRIRLGRKTSQELRSLARITSRKLVQGNAVQGKQETKSFRFADLPREIRLQVLWHTNLGPGGDFLPDLSAIQVVQGRFDQRYHLASMQNDSAVRPCCLDCSFTKLHCCCPLNYNAYSPQCRCRLLPFELFYTNRQIYKDASEIFYSTNLFRFQGRFSESQRMLEAIPVQSLRKIRRIKFELAVEQTSEWDDHQEEWHSLISFIGSHCDPSTLLLLVDAPDDMEFILGLVNDEDEEELSRSIYSAYIDIARTIKKYLPAVLDLHISLGIFLKMEPILEKFVLGPEYDSKHGNRYSKAKHGEERRPDADKSLLQIPPWHEAL